MKIISAQKLVELALLNEINKGKKPCNPIIEPTLITDLDALAGKECTVLELTRLYAKEGFEIILIPKALESSHAEADFLQSQLCFLEGASDEFLDNKENRRYTQLIKERATVLIESGSPPKELILAYATVCYFANNPMVRHFFPEADGLKLLVKYEMMYGFLSYVETDFFPDVDVDWKTRIIVDYYSQNRERE